MKIDVFNHFLPPAAFEQWQRHAPKEVARYGSGPLVTMTDLDARLRMLEPFADYCQVLCLPQPGLESLAGPAETPELARTANDGLAAACKAHPDRFPGFIAGLPMNNPTEAIKEAKRAIRELGACGIQIHSNVNGRPLDEPEFFPIFEQIAKLKRPIWLHPTRPQNYPDYRTETESKFAIFWGFGWAYETTAAMARLVFSGIFDKLPEIKIIAHHWGAYAPHAEGRFTPFWDARLPELGVTLQKPLVEYFKMFYGDSAMFGAKAASQAGLDFFGPAHSLFATDCPYDREGGAVLIKKTIEVVDGLRCTKGARNKIYTKNAKKLLRLKIA